MPGTQPTLLDIAVLNGCDATTGLIEEVVVRHPELEFGAARTIKGLNFPTSVRTSLPTVGFRAANSGTPASKSTYERRLIETYMFNPRWQCDKMVADSYEDGAPAFISIEAAGQMEASAILLCKQFYYGVANDALGFPGLQAFVDASLVVDATGTAVGGGSSLYAVKFGPQYAQWLWGNGGKLPLSPVTEVQLLDAQGNPYTGYMQEISGRPGLQLGSRYTCGRIKNLTTDVGKGLTDALIGTLLSKFPVGYGPDAMFCSRRSLEQLRKSRTATNATGAEAPIPTEVLGVPLYPTDSIVDTETIA